MRIAHTAPLMYISEYYFRHERIDDAKQNNSMSVTIKMLNGGRVIIMCIFKRLYVNEHW